MEAFVALGVPEGAPLLAVSTFVHLTGTAAICIRLIAVSTIIFEFLIMRAVLPAHGANTGVGVLTERITQRTILLLVLRAGREGLTDSAAGGLFPA